MGRARREGFCSPRGAKRRPCREYAAHRRTGLPAAAGRGAAIAPIDTGSHHHLPDRHRGAAGAVADERARRRRARCQGDPHAGGGPTGEFARHHFGHGARRHPGSSGNHQPSGCDGPQPCACHHRQRFQDRRGDTALDAMARPFAGRPRPGRPALVHVRRPRRRDGGQHRRTGLVCGGQPGQWAKRRGGGPGAAGCGFRRAGARPSRSTSPCSC